MGAPKPASRPRLAVWKFASCDGCQLTLLDCEDELLSLAAKVEIAYFLEASSALVPARTTCRWSRGPSPPQRTPSASGTYAGSPSTW